jgi:hypothetical protein
LSSLFVLDTFKDALYLVEWHAWITDMPKAVYSAPSGAVVTVEGTQEEVVSLLRLLETTGTALAAPQDPPILRQGKTTPMGLLAGLMSRGFFNQPRELGSVKASLEEEGQFYPTTTLSPLMLRLVRRRELRRIKEKGRWLYVR